MFFQILEGQTSKKTPLNLGLPGGLAVASVSAALHAPLVSPEATETKGASDIEELSE